MLFRSLAVLNVMFLLPDTSPTSSLWPYVLSLAAIWGLAAFVQINVTYFGALQLALYGLALLMVSRGLEAQTWYQDLRLKWADPWSVQSYGAALALMGIVWVLLRLMVRRWLSNSARWSLIIAPAPQAVDTIVNRGTWLLLGFMCLWSVSQGIDAEFVSEARYYTIGGSLLSIEPRQIPGLFAWLFWGASVVLLLARWVEQILLRRVVLLLVLLSLA